MPMDGLMLGFAVREIKDRVTDGKIDRVSQPESDVLLLTVRGKGETCKLLLSASPSFARAHLTRDNFINPADAPMFCMLMRKHLLGGRITSVEQLYGDRVMKIVVLGKDEMGDTSGKELYLELMGRHSNLTLVQDGRIIDAIRHVSFEMSRVRQALPGLPFVMPPRQDKLSPEQATQGALCARLTGATGRLDKALADILTGIGAVSAKEIAFRLTGRVNTVVEEEDVQALAARLWEFLSRISALSAPAIVRDETGMPSEIVPFPYLTLDTERMQPYPSLGDAMDAYFSGRDKRDKMKQKSASLRRIVRQALEKDEKKLSLQDEELSAGAKLEQYRIAGELLNAQGYLVQRGQDKVSLPNFYDEAGGSVEVELDVSLTPAQNAQRYFKKYRKARSALHLAAEQKEMTLREINVLEQALEDLEKCETEDELNDVRSFLQQNGVLRAIPERRKSAKRPPVSKPHHYVTSDGFDIYVGKNSAQNERLTHDASGDDMWLHAKDMPASHVILVTAGKKITDDALRTAIHLAAFYSKAKGVSVPVDYTYRKYVKKPAGTPLGFVTYTQQKCVMADVTEGEINGYIKK